MAAPVGLATVGSLIDKVGVGSLKKISLIAVAAAAILAVVAILLPLSPNLPIYSLMQGCVILTSTSYLVITSTIVSQTTTPRSTGKVLSVYLLLQALIGVGFAPLIVGALADTLFARTNFALGYAMATGGVIFGVLALVSAICLWRIAENAPATSIEPRAA